MSVCFGCFLTLLNCKRTALGQMSRSFVFESFIAWWRYYTVYNVPVTILFDSENSYEHTTVKLQHYSTNCSRTGLTTVSWEGARSPRSTAPFLPRCVDVWTCSVGLNVTTTKIKVVNFWEKKSAPRERKSWVRVWEKGPGLTLVCPQWLIRLIRLILPWIAAVVQKIIGIFCWHVIMARSFCDMQPVKLAHQLSHLQLL